MLLFDNQQSNNDIRAGYYAMGVFVYGFLLVIVLVALINIMNTINASVSSRMSNYCVMRAIGMSGNQLRRMVTAEAFAYASFRVASLEQFLDYSCIESSLEQSLLLIGANFGNLQ